MLLNLPPMLLLPPRLASLPGVGGGGPGEGSYTIAAPNGLEETPAALVGEWALCGADVGRGQLPLVSGVGFDFGTSVTTPLGAGDVG